MKDIQIPIEPLAMGKKGQYPKWIMERLEHAGHDRYNLGRDFGGTHHWIDHFGSLKDDPEVFISEPYGLVGDDFPHIMAFCDAIGGKVDIQAASTHYPTRTLRVIITKKNREPMLLEGREYV